MSNEVGEAISIVPVFEILRLQSLHRLQTGLWWFRRIFPGIDARCADAAFEDAVSAGHIQHVSFRPAENDVRQPRIFGLAKD